MLHTRSKKTLHDDQVRSRQLLRRRSKRCAEDTCRRSAPSMTIVTSKIPKSDHFNSICSNMTVGTRQEHHISTTRIISNNTHSSASLPLTLALIINWPRLRSAMMAVLLQPQTQAAPSTPPTTSNNHIIVVGNDVGGEGVGSSSSSSSGCLWLVDCHVSFNM